VAAAGLSLLSSLLGGHGAPGDADTSGGGGALPELNLFPESAMAGTGAADEEGEVIVIDGGEQRTVQAMIASLGFGGDDGVGGGQGGRGAGSRDGVGPAAGEDGGEEDLLSLMDSTV